MGGLRIEIVGNDERAQRMLRQVRALQAFDIYTVPDPNPSDAVNGVVEGTMLRVQSVRGGHVLLQENAATGEIEGIPVVKLDARPQRMEMSLLDPKAPSRSSPASIRVSVTKTPSRRWPRTPWSRRAAR